MPFLISFSTFAATPEDQSTTSHVILVDAINKVLTEGTGLGVTPTCVKEDIHLPTGYFMTMESGPGSGCANCGLVLYKDTDAELEMVRASELLKLKEKGKNVCCHSTFDSKGMCNSHCSDPPKPMVLGRGTSINDEVCVCLWRDTVYLYQPAWHEEIRPGWILDDCAKAGKWTL